MRLSNRKTYHLYRLLLMIGVAWPCIGLVRPAPSIEGSKTNESNIICTCTNVISVGVNLTQRAGQETIIPDRKVFRLYEDGVLQEIEYFRVYGDEEAKKNGYRYKLGYVTTNEKLDGAYRKIRIMAKAKMPRGIKLQQSREGYYATKENQWQLNRLPAEALTATKGCCG